MMMCGTRSSSKSTPVVITSSSEGGIKNGVMEDGRESLTPYQKVVYKAAYGPDPNFKTRMEAERSYIEIKKRHTMIAPIVTNLNFLIRGKITLDTIVSKNFFIPKN